MDSREKDALIQQAKGIAAFGFEQGFKQAIDFIQGIAENGKRQESRDTAKIFVKTLEQVLPELMKEVPEMFTFDVIEDPNNGNRIVFH